MAHSPLNILLLNHSDTAGGASVVSMRLLKALGSNDMHARMVVAHKNTDSLRVDAAATPRRTRIPFLAEHAAIYLNNGHNRDTLFKISTGAYGLPLHRHPWVQEADIIVLNWINQGMLSLDGIRRLAATGKQLVWIMHDQWNMTGICHYTDGCDNWTGHCGNCPLLGRAASPRDLSAKVWDLKKALYTDIPIHFVAVSSRLAELCRQSPLMEDADITVIPNAFPIDQFPTTPAIPRHKLGLPEGKKLITMGAARLDDPVKNLPLAIEALNLVYPAHPKATAVFYGNLRNPDLLKGLRIPHVWLGPIDNKAHIVALMAHTTTVISTSVWETLPTTIIEGVAAGATAATTANGGQSDIVIPGFNGYMAAATPQDMAGAISAALELPTDPESRLQRHRNIASRFAPATVAQEYFKLFNRITR